MEWRRKLDKSSITLARPNFACSVGLRCNPTGTKTAVLDGFTRRVGVAWIAARFRVREICQGGNACFSWLGKRILHRGCAL